MATCQIMNDIRNYDLFVHDPLDKIEVSDSEYVTTEKLATNGDQANAFLLGYECSQTYDIDCEVSIADAAEGVETVTDKLEVKDSLDAEHSSQLSEGSGRFREIVVFDIPIINMADDLNDDDILEKQVEEPLFDRGEAIECLCSVCYLDVYLFLRPCCQLPVCDDCVETYLKTCVEMARIRIPCPNDQCTVMMFSNEVLARLPPDLTIKYYRSLVDTNRNPLERTCPRCSEILSVSTEFLAKHRSKKGVLVKCRGCDLDWCFTCHAPWHRGMKCSTFKKGDKPLKHWSKLFKHGQLNAQRCPKCKVLIQRVTGCDSMTCSKCDTNFCYCCGGRFVHYTLLGGHVNRFSIFGCKNRLFPGSPTMRRAVRGALFVGLMGVIAVGMALAPAVSVVAVPIACVVKIRNLVRKRRGRREAQYYDMVLEQMNELRSHNPAVFPIIPRRPIAHGNSLPTELPSSRMLRARPGAVADESLCDSLYDLRQPEALPHFRSDSERLSASAGDVSRLGGVATVASLDEAVRRIERRIDSCIRRQTICGAENRDDCVVSKYDGAYAAGDGGAEVGGWRLAEGGEVEGTKSVPGLVVIRRGAVGPGGDGGRVVTTTDVRTVPDDCGVHDGTLVVDVTSRFTCLSDVARLNTND